MTDRIKTALVTGGAKRIGRAIVRDLAADGFAVAIHCNRSVDEGAALAEEIQRAGGKATMVAADLTDMSAAATLFDRVTAELGPLGLLVNSASIFTDDSPVDLDMAVLDRHFDIHLRAPVLLAGRLAAALPDDAEGLVVNIIDQRVWKLTPRYFSYTLSKAALWTATQTLAQALAPRVRVNAIGPGPTLQSVHQTQSDFAAEATATPLSRGPTLDEITAAVRFILATPSMTGQMIALDGGQHLS
jgi:NAD(P)-dependent dehydrogenase (short-subunit alcohol dehydrogenase family)